MSTDVHYIVKKYSAPKKYRRFFELIITIGGCIGLIIGAWMVFAFYPYYAMGFIIPLSLSFVRCFIIQHDCSHGSLFTINAMNRWLGRCISIITFTPFTFWRHNHLIHHRTSSNLDQRGTGDIRMLTTDEYIQEKWFGKLTYRLSRNPFVLFLLLAPLYFLVIMRFNFSYYYRLPGYTDVHRNSIYLTDLTLIIFYVALGLTLSFYFILLILLPAFLLAAIMGVWFFYVQHSFPNSYFARQEKWDYKKAALEGSSYYKLPCILEWLTGYIGYHHIHHLCPKIPFYRLRETFIYNEAFQSATAYGLKDTIMLSKLVLYDEMKMQFISWHTFYANKKNKLSGNNKPKSKN
ncbi:MAG: fatty acid desaturase [Francisellaceae bacterium]